MLNVKLPHIPRKISASLTWHTERACFWSLLIVLLLTNLYAKANFTPVYWDQILSVMVSPYRLAPHIDLAQSLWKAGVSREAQNELEYAKSLKLAASRDSQVLGTSTTDPETLLESWQNFGQNLVTRSRYWQNVVNEKPDYRDAYIILSALSYQLSQTDKSRKYLTKALALDPNWQISQKLENLLSTKN